MTDSDSESPTVALVTGHLFRGSESDMLAQAQATRTIRAQAEAVFAARRVGHLFGALACGSDIVVAEAALDAGVSVHVVLPLPFDPFAKLSIDIGDPEGRKGEWRARAEAVMARSASRMAAEEHVPRSADLDAYFHHGFRFMAGLALLQAQALRSECRLIAVTDGAEAAGLAGANRARTDWRRTRRPVDDIAFPLDRPAPAPHSGTTSPFRAVVLLQAPAGGGKTALVADTLDSALQLVRGSSERGARAICAFGPVLGEDAKPDLRRVDRLTELAEASGESNAKAPLATLAFAAEACLERPGFAERLEQVGGAGQSAAAVRYRMRLDGA